MDHGGITDKEALSIQEAGASRPVGTDKHSLVRGAPELHGDTGPGTLGVVRICKEITCTIHGVCPFMLRYRSMSG